MEKNTFPAAFLPEARGRQGSTRHPSPAPLPSTRAAAAQAPTANFPAPATASEGFTAPALSLTLQHPLGTSSPLPGAGGFRWCRPHPAALGGHCPNQLTSQTSAHLGVLSCSSGQSYKCRPSPFPSVTRESFAVPDKMIGGGGTFITSPSKQRTKPTQPPHRGPLATSSTRRCQQYRRMS